MNNYSETKPLPCDDIAALRKVHIRLLNAVDKVCRENNLSYWLDFGSLLGAYREGTFIPWDDDIDISMPIDDYNKFIRLAESELPNDIFLQTSKTDPTFKEYFAKLRDCNSTIIERHEDEKTKYHQGIFLDILPSIKYPYLPRLVLKVLMKDTLLTRYAAYVNNKHRWFNMPAYWLLKFIWQVLFLLPKNYYGQTPEDNGYMYAIPSKALYPLQKIKFAGGLYPAPKDIDLHLSTMYGKDYMKPLPLEKRVSHSKLILPYTPCNHPRAIHRTTSSNQT